MAPDSGMDSQAVPDLADFESDFDFDSGFVDAEGTDLSAGEAGAPVVTAAFRNVLPL